MKPIPLEEEEAITFMQWCDWNKIKATHIMQETYTTSWKQKMLIKALVRKGFPDFAIVLTPEQSKYGRGILLLLELKRQRRVLKNGKLGASPSRVEIEQIEWIEMLNKVADVDARVCYGCSESIEWVQSFMVEKNGY